MTEPDPEIINTIRVAQIFRVDPNTIRSWIKQNKFERFGIDLIQTPGNHTKFYRDQIYTLFWKMIEDGGLEE